MADLGDLVARAWEWEPEAEAELFQLAYSGSVDAQRAILDLATLNPPGPNEGFWFRVEMMARVRAESRDMGDVLRLCAVLYLVSLQMAQPEARNRLQAEILAELRERADAGEGEALAALVFYAPQFSPEVREAGDREPGKPVKDWGPPAIVRLPAHLACQHCAPADRWGGFKVWLVDRSWAMRRLWWALKDRMGAR